MRQKKTKLLIVLVFLGLFLALFFLFRHVSQREPPSPEWQHVGPPGASVQEILIDPSDPRVLYAAIWQGFIHKSTDGAQSWVCLSDESGPSGRTLAMDPNNPQVLYVGDFGIYKSADGGTSWEELPKSFEGRVSRVVVDPVNSQTIYAATEGSHPLPGGIYKSMDGGYSWSDQNAGLIIPPETSSGDDDARTWYGISELIIDPKDSNIIYAAARGRGVCKSTDGGNTWTAIGFADFFIGSLAIDPTDTDVIYAVTGDSFIEEIKGNGIYKSTDGGESWNPINAGLDCLDVQDLAIDPGDPATIYAGTTDDGIYKTTNGGDSWSAMNTGLVSDLVWNIAIDPQNPQTVYLGTRNAVCKSTNGGDSWTEKNNGLKYLDVSKVAVVAGEPKTIYTWAGVTYRSEDGGGSWSAVGAPLPGNVLGIHPKNQSIVYMKTKQKHLRRSTDGGASWKTLTVPHEDWIFAMDPGDSQIMYLGTEGAGVFKSTDRGDSWNAVNNGLDNLHVRSVEISPTDPQILYARVADNISEVPDCSDLSTPPECVYRSTDGGASWEPLMGLHGHILTLAMDPVNSQVLYAGVECGGVYKSEDGGYSWRAARSGLSEANVRTLQLDPTDPQVIYAGTEGDGVYKSLNGGDSWTVKNTGLDNLSVTALQINPKQPRILYAGTEGGGVYKSVDSAGSWTMKNTGLDNLTVRALQIDPADPKILYAGTDGGGVFKSIDGADSWTAKNNRLTLQHVKDLVIDSNNSQNIHVSTAPFDWRKNEVEFIKAEHYGFFLSQDGGDTWLNIGFVSEIMDLAIDTKDPSTVYAASVYEGIYKSTDVGPWNQIGLDNLHVRNLLIDSMNPQTIYAVSATVDGIWKSTDGGDSWIILGTPQGARVFDPVNPQIVYAGSYGGIFKSTDGGDSWKRIDEGSFSQLQTDPVNPKVIYAPHLGYHYMTMSTNGGQSWFSAGPAEHITYLTTDPTNPQILYAGTSSGVWKSTDGGDGWDMLGSLYSFVWGVEIDPSDPEIIYAATSKGLGKFDQKSIQK